MPFPLESFEQLQGFFWVFIRVSIIVFMLPLFGARGLPTLWKVGLSMVMAMVLVPVVPPLARYPVTMVEVLIGILSEALVGLVLGLAVRILFASVQVAGQFMAFQMGFSLAAVMDPNTGVRSTVLSQFLYFTMILIFFSIDGHHLFIRALAASFEIISPYSFSFSPSIPKIIIGTSVQMFVMALKIAAPIMIALFLSNLCLGIVARTVPQVNILMVGFPINIGIGLIFFSLILANLSPFLTAFTKGIGQVLMKLISVM
jgi:flagellar biosynthetic protein FliR